LLHISALGLLPVLAACGEAASLGAPSPLVRDAVGPRCATFNGPKGSTYNEFLGINDRVEVVGYAGGVGPYEFHPGKSYEIERYPGSVDTELTSLNNDDAVAGWYEGAEGKIYGLTEWQGIWTKYSSPRAGGRAMRILGINDSGEVTGYYENRHGIDQAFVFHVGSKFRAIHFDMGTVASAINNRGRIVGWATVASGATEGWLFDGKLFTNLAYPGAVSTQPSGINESDEIVGSYEDASRNTHGFILTQPLKAPYWREFDEPRASGSTVLAGINDRDDLVGHYQNGSGRIVAFLCRQPRAVPSALVRYS
jgi:probable HAF family extracellular repeat protein